MWFLIQSSQVETNFLFQAQTPTRRAPTIGEVVPSTTINFLVPPPPPVIPRDEPLNTQLKIPANVSRIFESVTTPCGQLNFLQRAMVRLGVKKISFSEIEPFAQECQSLWTSSPELIALINSTDELPQVKAHKLLGMLYNRIPHKPWSEYTSVEKGILGRVGSIVTTTPQTDTRLASSATVFKTQRSLFDTHPTWVNIFRNFNHSMDDSHVTELYALIKTIPPKKRL